MQETTPRLPVYVSCPNRMDPEQEASAHVIRGLLEQNGLEWTALGLTHYPVSSPLQEVLALIKQCYGGVILGLRRSRAYSVTAAKAVEGSSTITTPWHQIEAAALIARELPILIFKEPEVQGGIFDQGASDVFIHDLPPNDADAASVDLFASWAKQVREHYEIANSIFDVFLSFSGEDEATARTVFEFLTAQGLRVFFSRESVPQLAQADYMKAINEAVDRARHMVVLSSSASGFAKPWVEREWTMFLNEKLSGRKNGNLVVVQPEPIPVAALPIALRSQQVVTLSETGLPEVSKFVSQKQESS
jgi:hypothetical protein